MEYLVTMTTHVPDGTAQQAVDEVRAREAAHSAELAAQRHLLRLWRPPLAPHPNDPPADAQASTGQASTGQASTAGPEFFTWFTPEFPDDASDQEVDEAEAAEARRTRELAGQGHLVRLWRLPDSRVLGLWRAADEAEMRAIRLSLPLNPWLSTVITPLTRHPSDPGVSRP